jgi:uncharacterized protein YdhG (YjbR/CyaY superfamily)
MKKKAAVKQSKGNRRIVPGGVNEYLAKCPKQVQKALKDMRAAIRSVVPDAVETVSYFDMPGYSYEGYPYNGMFAWFSYKAPYVRLHVRPKALVQYQKDIEGYETSKAIVYFPAEELIPKVLVKKLVKASLSDMKSLVT